MSVSPDLGLRAKLWAMLRLLRPKQWVKNVFVFAPLVFSRQFQDPDKVAQSLVAFGLFCLAASVCYILNDLRDIESDRRHVYKRWSRPIAAGQVTPREAQFMIASIAVVLAAGFAVQWETMLAISGYVALNVAYTYVLKYRPVIDIFTVAIGFVLRVYAGAVAIDVPLSGWMMITTLCLALYLASVKRRQELAGSSGSEGRRVLEKYSVALVDRYAEMAATGALMFYSLFVMSTHQRLTITIPFVIFGLFRYWYVVEQQEGGESPTDVLLYDWPLLAAVSAWVAICVWVISSS